MSNYTDFFPLAGGGGGGGSEITDPTKLPLLMTQKDDTGTFPESPLNMFFSMNETGVDDYDEADILSSPNLANPLLGTSTTTGSATRATVNVTNATEATILNVTGSGYLCNVATAITNVANSGVDGTLTITIIADGTTYTFSADPNSSTTTSNFYTRLLWGFHSKGNNISSTGGSGNMPYAGSTSQQNPGIMGFGNDSQIHFSSSLPPSNRVDSNSSSSGRNYNLRVFGPTEFKNLNLPKLRFESSLVVKTQTNNLYTASTSWTRAGASYYLDSFLM